MKAWSTAALALTVIVFVGADAAESAVRPPSDDGDRSTVRLNTAWIEHTLNTDKCLQSARATLAAEGYLIDLSDKSVFGLKEDLTTAMRCDRKGVAFFVMAFRKRPAADVQSEMMKKLTDGFEKLVKQRK